MLSTQCALQPATDGRGNWYALYTRARFEKRVEAQLLDAGIDAFTPKVTLKRRWSDRVKQVEVPLFKSYCFARFPLEDKSKIIAQKGVVTVVHFKEKYIPVSESVINSLKLLVENRVQLDLCPYLKKGDRVAIKKGPLRGLEGFILEKRNKNTTLVISIRAIGASVSCIIDADSVKSA